MGQNQNVEYLRNVVIPAALGQSEIQCICTTRAVRLDSVGRITSQFLGWNCGT